MNKIKIYVGIVLIVGSLILSSFMYCNQIVDYFHISRELIFDGVNYSLSWSDHPSDIYYKQEYVPKTETVDHFHNMVLIEFLKGDLDIKDAIKAQLSVIVERKKTDKICNYKLIFNEKTGEYILDFVNSEISNDKLSLIEWNAYKYRPYVDKVGHKGIMLTGFSHREYGDENGADFLKKLADYRNEMLKKLYSYNVPAIQLD